MPEGLKPVRRRLATGEVKVYWYHRATGKPLRHDPATAEGWVEVAALDDKAKAVEAASGPPGGSFAALWTAYTDRTSEAWTSLKPRTRSDYQAVRDWIGQAAEVAGVRTITADDITALREKATRERGARFGKYVLQVVRLVLEWGKTHVEAGTGRKWLDVNPAMGMKLPKRKKQRKKANRPWTLVELTAFATDCPAQLLVPFVLGLLTMREGDALISTWSAYDGALLEWIAGKNGEPCQVPVLGAFKAILDEAKARRGRALQIAVNSHGDAWTESGFRSSFFKRLAKLRDAGAVKPGLTFHGLRSTVATIARDGGASDFRVAALIGDRSIAMATIYAANADRERAQREVMGDVQKQLGNNDWKMPDRVNGKRVTGATRRKGRKPL